MSVEELKKEIDDNLEKQLYEVVFELVRNNTEIVKESNPLSYLYYLCELSREEYADNGGLGILQEKRSVDDVAKAYLEFKRIVQRIAYCPEYDIEELASIMKKTNANAKELLWTINAATFNPEEVLGKIKGDFDTISVGKSSYKTRHMYKDVKLDFIICSNDSKELEEALFYISRLYVPDGVEMDVLSIEGATSMCAGYNEGMEASSAKYKVYMHHDVRILERYFIPRLIDIFMDNENVGLIGMVGAKEFPTDGCMWHMNRYGSVWDTHVHETSEIREYPVKKDMEVLICDGLLLATQYDLPWREDLLNGWDFYDASQCMEFHRNGYKVMVPYQESSWCVHDCGFLNLTKYDKYKDIFLNEYVKDVV